MLQMPRGAALHHITIRLPAGVYQEVLGAGRLLIGGLWRCGESQLAESAGQTARSEGQYNAGTHSLLSSHVCA